MLVVSRKAGETVVVGNNITFKVIEVQGDQVRIAVEAPAQVPIFRGELAHGPREPAGPRDPAHHAFVCEW
jgi:carbon storage regulator